jgi:hypothetical protein
MMSPNDFKCPVCGSDKIVVHNVTPIREVEILEPSIGRLVRVEMIWECPKWTPASLGCGALGHVDIPPVHMERVLGSGLMRFMRFMRFARLEEEKARAEMSSDS